MGEEKYVNKKGRRKRWNWNNSNVSAVHARFKTRINQVGMTRTMKTSTWKVNVPGVVWIGNTPPWYDPAMSRRRGGGLLWERGLRWEMLSKQRQRGIVLPDGQDMTIGLCGKNHLLADAAVGSPEGIAAIGSMVATAVYRIDAGRDCEVAPRVVVYGVDSASTSVDIIWRELRS